jgi:chromate transporter
MTDRPHAAPPALSELSLYFLKLGGVGFGGPAALVDRMRRDLLERRGWLTAAEFELGVTIAAACPGPLAYQLAVYCGYVRHGALGAFAVGAAFALIPFALVSAVAAGYEQWSTSVLARGLFYGAGPVVVALVARACWNLGRTTLHRAPVTWVLCTAGAAITWTTEREPLWLFALAGVLGVFLLRPDASHPRNPAASPTTTSHVTGFAAILATLAPTAAGTTTQLFAFFFKTGCLVFGSGLVIVPFLRSAVVDTYHWMTVQQFLDAVTVGLVSPGPVVITATFVGYLVGQWPGAVAATIGMFLPAILSTIIAAPWFARHQDNSRLTGLVRGITATVVGVLAGTVPLIARGAVPDRVAAAILVVAIALMARRRVSDPVLIALGAVTGGAVAWATGAR